MKVVDDGVEATPGYRVQNWGELLALLDQECASRGVVVADVAFDGIAAPSFREPALIAGAVAAVRIDVGTASHNELLLTAIEEACGAAERMRSAAIELSGAFRTHDLERGNRDLAEFAPSLGALMTLAGNIVQLAGVDAVVDGDGSGAVSIGALAGHIDTIIQSRAAGDWIVVADVLEHEVVKAIDGCVDVLSTVRREVVKRSKPS